MTTKDKTWVSLDTETFLMGEGAIAPKVICISLATRINPNRIESDLLAHCDDRTLPILEGLLGNDDVALIGHNMAYDLTCLISTWEHLRPLIYDKLGKGLVHDTQIREKLLNLGQFGHIQDLPQPDGGSRRVSYTLSSLEKRYTGVDRSEFKEGDDIWRLRYHELEGKAAEDYPTEARDYALDDAIGTLRVFEEQELRRSAPRGPGSCNTEELQVFADFCLRVMTINGVRIDRELRDSKAKELGERMLPENLPRLIRSGILRPATPPRPYKNMKKKLAEVFPDLPADQYDTFDWEPYRENLQENGIKFTSPKKPSVNTKALAEVILAVCEEHQIPPTKTPSGAISAEGAVLEVLAPFNKILQEYKDRQEIARLVNSELPKLDADRVHPEFDILKETGRTSSYGGSLYPSTNIQQVDPRARDCFIPDPGHVFASVDYSALELVSVAQKTFSLFGYSVHRDKVLAGYDLHSFLGSQLALHLDEDFAQTAKGLDADEVYDKFFALKTSENQSDRKFWKHWRTFAKPTGLGYPGGLGPATFVKFAAAVYGVAVDEGTAAQLKELWLGTYPEMVDYFIWINQDCQDQSDPSLYCYETPMGMWRACCSYCACANGACMQSPSAEGAKKAIIKVVRECETPGSLLYGCKPWAFIHDEIMLQIPDDLLAGARADRVAELMVDGMKEVFPDVPIEAEPALMRRWSKAAEEVRDDEGNLLVWEPEEDE